MGDLSQHIDWSSVECLNAKPGTSIENVLKQGYREDDALLLESDTDDQLLVHVPFNQVVRLSGIIVKATGSPAHAPKSLKLFVDRPTIGFAEAADSPGVQEFDLSAEELQGKVLPLRLVKFNRVHCLTLFIQSNQEDEDCTILQKIAFLGTAGDTMDVAQIKDISKDQE